MDPTGVSCIENYFELLRNSRGSRRLGTLNLDSKSPHFLASVVGTKRRIRVDEEKKKQCLMNNRQRGMGALTAKMVSDQLRGKTV